MTGDGADVVYLGHSMVSREEYERMNSVVIAPNGTSINPFPDNGTGEWMKRSIPTIAYMGNVSSPEFRESKFIDHLHLSVDLPGVEQKDLKLEIEGNILKVQYSRIDEGMNRFVHHYINADEFDVRNVKANFRACILNLTFDAIPKPAPEKIEIQLEE